MSVSDQVRTAEVPSVCVTKPWTTPWATGVAKEEILSPSVNFGQVLVQLSRDSRGFMQLVSIRISSGPWSGNSTVFMDDAMGPENAEFPHHKAWVELACHGSCEAGFANLKLFDNGGMVLASGLFPAVH